MAGVRWTTRAQWHVTLHFLGEVLDERVPDVVAALGVASATLAPAPVVLSLVVASLMARALPEPIGPFATVAWWAALLVGSGVALVVFDRLFRRLLPLSVLLNLALVFPGAAPSRFSAAIRAGSVHN